MPGRTEKSDQTMQRRNEHHRVALAERRIVIKQPGRKSIYSGNSKQRVNLLVSGKNVINSLCGGNGKCGKCRIKFLNVSPNNQEISADVSIPTETEHQLLGDSIYKNIRLACQVIPKDKDIKVRILDLSEYQDSIFKIQDSFSDFKLNFLFIIIIQIKSF